MNAKLSQPKQQFPDAKKVSLGTGIVGEAILSPKSELASALMKPKQTKLPSLPPKRSPAKSPRDLQQKILYQTMTTNPFKALVAPKANSNEVPASKYIEIHHCSIEFNNQKPVPPPVRQKPTLHVKTNAESRSSLAKRI